jgi:hypothetical protein
MLGKNGFVNFLKEFNNARQKHFDTGEVQYIPATKKSVSEFLF